MDRVHPPDQSPEDTKESPSFPLSPSQERLWEMKWIVEDAALNMAVSLRWHGSLDRQVLRSAVQDMTVRYDSLRVVLHVVDGRPRKHIEDELTIPFIVKKLDYVNDELLAEEMRWDMRHTFFLLYDPLFSVVLYELSDDDHVIFLIANRMICDDRSRGIIEKELLSIYKSKLENREHPPAPTSDNKYLSFSIRQKAFLENKEIEKIIHDRGMRIAGDLLSDHPPASYAPPNLPRYHGEEVPFILDEDTTRLIQGLADEFGTSTNIFLLSVFIIIQHRFTNQEQVVASLACVPVEEEMSEEIGPYTNTQIMNVDCSGNPPFAEFLFRVKKEYEEVLDFRRIPFERFMKEESVQALIESAFVHTSFSYHKYKSIPSMNNVRVERQSFDPGISLFQLSMHLEETDGKIQGSFNYNTDMFDITLVKNIINSYKMLIASLYGYAHKGISEIFILPIPERDRIIYEFNNTLVHYDENTTIAHMFERSAVAFPENTAVAIGEKKITYRDLDVYSNQVARLLKHAGVQKNDYVVVFLKRSIFIPESFLAIMKSRAAFIFIDPDRSPESIQRMIIKANARTLITESSSLPDILETMNTFSDIRSIIVMDDPEETSPEWHYLQNFTGSAIYTGKDFNLMDDDELDDKPMGYDPAYVRFSEDGLDGMVFSHRTLTNQMQWFKRELDLKNDDIFGPVISFDFHLSLAEIFLPLVSGACLQIALSDKEGLLHTYKNAIRKYRITVSSLPPYLYYQIMDSLNAADSGAFATLRTLIVGSGILKSIYVRRFRNLFSDSIKLLYVYGPPETVLATYNWIMEDSDLSRSTVLPGTPVDNTVIYIMNRYNGLSPIDVVGEISIGGDALMTEYLHDPEKTGHTLQQDPFLEDGSIAYIYRTGHTGVLQEDGRVRHIRTDENPL